MQIGQTSVPKWCPDSLDERQHQRDISFTMLRVTDPQNKCPSWVKICDS